MCGVEAAGLHCGSTAVADGIAGTEPWLGFAEKVFILESGWV